MIYRFIDEDLSSSSIFHFFYSIEMRYLSYQEIDVEYIVLSPR